MEFETYTQQAYQYLYKPCLATLNQNQLPLSNNLYTSTEYILIEVICRSPQNTPSSSNLSFIFNALANLGLTFAYIVQVIPNQVKTYIVLQHAHLVPLGLDILFQGLESLSNHLELQILHHSQDTLDELFFTQSKAQTLSMASLIPNPDTSSSLLNQLIALLPQDTYTLMFLAEPIPRACYLQSSNCLHKLYFNLSKFREITFSSNTSTTYTDSNTSSKTCTQNESSSLSKTDTHSDANNSSKTHSTSMALSNKLNDKISASYNASDSCNTSNNLTSTNSVANNSSTQNTDADSSNSSKTCTTVESSGTNARALQSEVIHLIEQLDLLFIRLRATQSLSMFNFCTYFFAPDPATCVRAAFNYAGLAASDSFPLSNQYVNTWLPHSPYISQVFSYLRCFHHPIFFTLDHCDYISPTFPISSKEFALAIQFCLT